VIPAKRIKRATMEITLASLVLVDSRGKTLLLAPPKSARQSAPADDVHTLVSRMWHFPTIVVPQDQAAVALKKFAEESFLSGRKLRAELHPLKKLRHAVTYRSITIFPFRAEVGKLPRVPASKAFPLEDLSTVAISNLTRKVARTAVALK